MIERYFRVKNFRNIGTDGFEKLMLNQILTKDDKMGDLITLIGMNNSGKSNYLDAIMYLTSKVLKPNDRPIFNFGDDYSPTVTMWLNDHDESIRYEYSYVDGKVHVNKYIKNEKVSPGEEFLDISVYSFKDLFSDMDNSTIERLINLTSDKKTLDAYKELKLNNNINKDYIQIIYDYIKAPELVNSHIRRVSQEKFNSVVYSMESILKNNAISNINYENKLQAEVFEKYHINFVPNVIKYDDSKTFKDLDTVLVAKDGKVNDNEFFKLVFSYLDTVSYKGLEEAYDKFNSSKQISRYQLSNFQKQANKELKKLAVKFNKIYSFNNLVQYSFRFVIESERTYFVISEGDNDVPLDTQSTGFKWFFNFFFNVFANDKLGNGDIVILDEPATNLHVLGQQELRKQIKDFGLQNGITFVISTHSPFLIDADYLDELRLVAKDGYSSRLYNNFTVDFNGNNTADTLLPVYSALTVDKHILLNPDSTLIFVEGITDYNYLVAFKKLFKMDDLNFLPFQGTKNKDIINALLKTTNNPIVLVDSDMAGKEFINKYRDHKVIEMHELKSVNEEWKEIEDLFSPQDRKVFKALDKKSSISSYFKNHILDLSEVMTKKTKENFQMLLEYLSH